MAVERELRCNSPRGPAQPPHVARPHLPGRVPLERRQERRKRDGRSGQATAGSERVGRRPDRRRAEHGRERRDRVQQQRLVALELLEVAVGQWQPFEQREHGARLDAHVADAYVAALIDDERALQAPRLAPPVAEPAAVSAPGTGRGRRAKVGCRNRHGATLDRIRARRQDALSDMAQLSRWPPPSAAVKRSRRSGSTSSGSG